MAGNGYRGVRDFLMSKIDQKRVSRISRVPAPIMLSQVSILLGFVSSVDLTMTGLLLTTFFSVRVDHEIGGFGGNELAR